MYNSVSQRFVNCNAGCEQNGALSSKDGRLDARNFEMAMRQQLRQYASRRLCDFLIHGSPCEADRAQASSSAKHIMLYNY